MATVSSHVLDSVAGGHAAGVRVQLFCLEGDARSPVFDQLTDAEGRISEQVEIDQSAEYELVFHGHDYFAARDLGDTSPVSCVVVRFVMDDDTRRYHIPVMLAPHSYSTWWPE